MVGLPDSLYNKSTCTTSLGISVKYVQGGEREIGPHPPCHAVISKSRAVLTWLILSSLYPSGNTQPKNGPDRIPGASTPSVGSPFESSIDLFSGSNPNQNNFTLEYPGKGSWLYLDGTGMIAPGSTLFGANKKTLAETGAGQFTFGNAPYLLDKTRGLVYSTSQSPRPLPGNRPLRNPN